MDLMIAGTPRSGSTMLASWLHVPPSNVVINEPNNHGANWFSVARPDGRALRILKDLKSPLEQPFDEAKWPEWISLLDDREARGELRWGVKLVRGPAIQEAYKVFMPRKVVFIIRDPKACALSYIDRIEHADVSRPRKAIAHRLQWIADACTAVNEMVDKVPDSSRILVFYEEFVSASFGMNVLRELLNKKIESSPWLGDGNLRFHFDEDKRTGGRAYEADRHDGQITTKSRVRSVPEEWKDDIRRFLQIDAVHRFRSRWRYG